MSENTNNTATGGNTFSQEQLNAIVSKRLAEEKAKSEVEFAKKEQEFARRELLLSAKEKLTAKGLPLELLDALNMSSAEALDKSLSIIEKMKPSQPFSFVGVKPGESKPHLPDNDKSAELRKAMGLK